MDPRFSTVPEPLWRAVAPLLPPEPPKPRGGRPHVPARAVLAGILYRLRTGCQSTEAFVAMLKRYDRRRGIRWKWAALDGFTVEAPNVDRAQAGPVGRS